MFDSRNFFFLCIFFGLTIGQEILPSEFCDNQGECYESASVGHATNVTLEQCRNECQENQLCLYFTWFGPGSSGPNSCVLYSDCDDFNATICTDCYTGGKNCTLYECAEQGFCTDSLYLASGYVQDAKECLEFCRNWTGCNWFSFDGSANNFCELTSDCPNVDKTCTDCTYGPVECPKFLFNIMVATGYNGLQMDDVEMLDIETWTSCSNLPAAYPLSVDHAVALKHDSKPVICGGIPLTSDCYSYSNNEWNIEPFRLEPPRYGAMSVEVKPGEWVIMGGSDGSTVFSEVLLLKDGMFTQLLTLPQPMFGGSATKLNDTHALIAAGFNGTHHSPYNYLLNVDTEQWTQIADRNLSPWEFHSSGTFYNASAGETQVANLGFNGIEIFSPQDNSWHSGISSSVSNLFSSPVVQNGTESFILIGGEADLALSGHVYSFNESGLTILKQNVLKLPRTHHVAVSASIDEFTCTV